MSGLAFLGGAAQGYVDQSRYQDQKKRLDQEMQIRLADAAFQQNQNQRTLDQQQDLAQAAQPAQIDVGAGGVTKPATADNIDVGQPGEPGADAGGLQPGAMVNGQSVPDQPAALAAAKAYDDPAARLARQSDVLEKYRPGSGLALQDASLKLTAAQQERQRTIKFEGLDDAARAAATGDPQGVFDAFNKSGSMKFTGVPTVTVRERDDIPGMPAGTKTYDYSGEITDASGNKRTGTINSFDYGQSVLPPKEAYGLAIKGTTADGLAAYRDSIAKARQDTADASKTRAQAYADREKYATTGITSREDRLKYQDLVNKASVNMVQQQKVLSALQADRRFMAAASSDPNSTQAAQLAGAQADLARHKADYQLYQGMLANTGRTAGAAAPAADPPAQPGMTGAFNGDPADVTDQISRIPDPQERANATAALGQQMKANGGTLPTAPVSLANVPFKGRAAPVKIGSKAERDALPKGATYIAPNGQQYVKQ